MSNLADKFNSSDCNQGVLPISRESEKNSEMVHEDHVKESRIPEYVRVMIVEGTTVTYMIQEPMNSPQDIDLNGRKRKLYIPSALDLDRPKRPRTIFTTEQVEMLELEFSQTHFVSESRRHVLSLLSGLSQTQIKVWFQNRRTKLRRILDLSKSCRDKSKNSSYENFITNKLPLPPTLSTYNYFQSDFKNSSS